MKMLLTLCALLAGTLSALAQLKPQSVEILMIGTLHDYGSQPTEKFDYVKNKVRAFRPDAMAGEYLSASDYDKLADYWNKESMEKRYAYVKSLGYPAPKNPDRFIRNTYRLLRDHPYYHQERMKLANALLQRHDYGNAQFQLYQLMQYRNAFGAEERATFTRTLGPIDSLKRLGYRTAGEYYHLFFPLLAELKLDQLLPMDCQAYDAPWQEAWNATDSLVKVFEKQVDKDSLSAEALAYKKLNQRTKTLAASWRMAEKNGTATQFANSPEGDEFMNNMNFYGGKRLFGMTGFPQKEITEMLTHWQLRNEGMCHNLVTRAREAGAKRIVVGVGTNHRAIMVSLLRTMPGVTVRELNE